MRKLKLKGQTVRLLAEGLELVVGGVLPTSKQNTCDTSNETRQCTLPCPRLL